ncbi:MAG: SDR family oxidoreductase [Anaerolineales bacterium]|jgi:NAD(P)-dependent dehydrogenase (short-subunit alcohol dehydrogenase family)
MGSSKLALITGANRGLGLETARQLAQLGQHVIMTSRDDHAGRLAMEKLSSQGSEVEYQRLDVEDIASIEAVKKSIEEKYGHLDVLINNAGIYIDRGQPALRVDEDNIKKTFEVNFYGPLRTCQTFIPLMQAGGYGRVVNVSSGMGSLTDMGGGALGYKVSKTALNALTRILAAEVKGDNIKVNAVNPGWVRTDMGGTGASRSLEQGAAGIVWAATLPDDGPTGGFFRDGQLQDW